MLVLSSKEGSIPPVPPVLCPLLSQFGPLFWRRVRHRAHVRLVGALIVVADSGDAVLTLLDDCRRLPRPITMITRLWPAAPEAPTPAHAGGDADRLGRAALVRREVGCASVHVCMTQRDTARVTVPHVLIERLTEAVGDAAGSREVQLRCATRSAARKQYPQTIL